MVWKFHLVGGVAQTGDILRYQDIVYAQQWPDRTEGAAEAGAGLFKGVLPFLCQGVVGVRHWGVVEVAADYCRLRVTVYVFQYAAHLFRAFYECPLHFFVGLYYVAGDFLRTEFGIARFHFIFFNMNWGVNIFTNKALIKKNVDAEVIDNYLDIVAQCEFARFAPGDPAAMMDKIFTEASEAINKLDSIIKW